MNISASLDTWGPVCRHQILGQVITSHINCWRQLLVPALDTCSSHDASCGWFATTRLDTPTTISIEPAKHDAQIIYALIFFGNALLSPTRCQYMAWNYGDLFIWELFSAYFSGIWLKMQNTDSNSYIIEVVCKETAILFRFRSLASIVLYHQHR